jgi:hypothetical protein
LGGGNNFVAIIAIASLCSLVSVTQKEERKNDRHKGTNRDKKKFFYNWRPLGNMKKRI